ncbi:MAG: DUF4381 domain-containing protein [Pseudomonadota bacterium]
MSETAAQTPLTLVDLVDQLVPPTEPPPVSMLPQTGGWVVLAVIAGMLVLWVVWRWRVRYLANAYRRAALDGLQDAGSNPDEVARLLRRTALAAFSRKEVASLSGATWLDFLDRTGGGTSFSKGAGLAVADAPYRPDGTPAEGLEDIAADWVRHHRRDDAP